MSKKILSEETIISSTVGNSSGIPIGEYRKFLYETMGKDFIDSMDYTIFQKWLFSHTGKTLKEVVDEHKKNYKAENIKELLSERRFCIISKPDKAFIIAFDKSMNEIGYDCENIVGSGLVWGVFMIIYGKTDTKNRPCVARIYIRQDGIVLRLFFSTINKHRVYIENANEHIKNAFAGGQDCPCRSDCKFSKVKKTYFVDDKKFEKCAHAEFIFSNPNLEKLPDYISLLLEFYPVKKSKK